MLIGVIAGSRLPSAFITNFTSEPTLPLTSTFGTIANGFTEGYVYWGGGRDQSATNFYSFYSRTTSSTTWTYQNAKGQIGQFQASAYPVGSTNKWLKNGGEYGGALNACESMVYGSGWSTETTYPLYVHYNGMGVIRNTKVAYSIAGSQPGSVFITNVYSYTGSGSWNAQTTYPINAETLQYKTVSMPTKVVVCGGYNSGSGNLSVVYSYTGSGSWTLENNLPADLTANSYQAAYVYNPDTAKVYAVTNNTTNVYYWTGSGGWTLAGDRIYGAASYPRNLAAVGSSLFALGGDYRSGNATCFRAVVR